MSCQRLKFTLVELLVVISIIALLAALLLPVLSKTRDRASAAKCLSSVKQVTLMHLMYTEMFKGFFCPAWDAAFVQWDATGDYKSPGLLARAVKMDSTSGEVFECPIARSALYFNKRWSAPFAGFGYNYLLSFASARTYPPNFNGLKINRVARPAQVVIVADAGCFLTGTGGTPAPTAFLYNPSSGTGGYADFRHGGRACGGYVDGHGEISNRICARPADSSGYTDRLGYLSDDDRAYNPDL